MSIMVSPDAALQSLSDWIVWYKRALTRVNKKYEELRSEYDKDEEISSLKKHIEKLHNEQKHSFILTQENLKAIDDWKDKHNKEKHGGDTCAGAIGGKYSYEFMPTSVGEIGVIKCSCGEEFCFKNIS